MLNLIWLRSLVVLMQQGSFQAAATTLGIAQPTLSQHIQKLETLLSVTLIHRGRTVCQPTEYAMRILPFAESLLSLNERAMQAVKTEQIRIGASSNVGIYMLQPYLSHYLQSVPQDKVDLTIDNNPKVSEKLLNAEVDIAVMEWWQPKPAFCSTIWKQEPLVMITPLDHPLAALPVISREMLAGLSLIGGEPGSGTGRLLKSYLQDQKMMPKITMQLGSTEAVKQAVMAGLGVSLVLMSAVKKEQQRGELAIIPLADQALLKPIQLVWRKDSHQAAEFVSHLMQTSL